jgi:hypothetical protein
MAADVLGLWSSPRPRDSHLALPTIIDRRQCDALAEWLSCVARKFPPFSHTARRCSGVTVASNSFDEAVMNTPKPSILTVAITTVGILATAGQPLFAQAASGGTSGGAAGSSAPSGTTTRGGTGVPGPGGPSAAPGATQRGTDALGSGSEGSGSSGTGIESPGAAVPGSGGPGSRGLGGTDSSAPACTDGSAGSGTSCGPTAVPPR